MKNKKVMCTLTVRGYDSGDGGRMQQRLRRRDFGGDG